ncbi:hypothetical protein P7K49_025732 [Saguinus oedipus]|uniref:Uncharacterized protein n=1 Tax=Saguinus oedipus TaxID=9490 RepID=A0ABQ9UJG1_SAGOE|nr:hypothetical protein P7K49_025732 [Saguinus oedipus]
MVFSILFGLLADRYGRWKILLISFLWGAYFSLLTSFAPSYIWFVFLRTMVGCGVSGHSQGLIIKTEFLPTKYRGYMLPLSQRIKPSVAGPGCYPLGCAASLPRNLVVESPELVSYLRGWAKIASLGVPNSSSGPSWPLTGGFESKRQQCFPVFWLAGSLLIIGLASVIIPTIGWRWLIRVASIPGIILIMAFKFIPESARFNVSTGNTPAALATLEHIAKMNRAVMPEGKLVEPVLEKRGRFADLLDAKYLRTTLQIWVIWLGISFAYYGVILASAELLERDLVCGSKSDSEVVMTQGDSEESQSPCHCHMFAPSDYRTMIISTVGEIALNPLNILGINFLGRRLSLSITMGCTALFFLLLNICTSSYHRIMGANDVVLTLPTKMLRIVSAGLIGFLFVLRALVAANFNTIYIYTAEVSFHAGLASNRVCKRASNRERGRSTYSKNDPKMTQKVYPTTMRALGMGTSGSLCRIGAMVAPFISQIENNGQHEKLGQLNDRGSNPELELLSGPLFRWQLKSRARACRQVQRRCREVALGTGEPGLGWDKIQR